MARWAAETGGGRPIQAAGGRNRRREADTGGGRPIQAAGGRNRRREADTGTGRAAELPERRPGGACAAGTEARPVLSPQPAAVNRPLSAIQTEKEERERRGEQLLRIFVPFCRRSGGFAAANSRPRRSGGRRPRAPFLPSGKEGRGDSWERRPDASDGRNRRGQHRTHPARGGHDAPPAALAPPRPPRARPERPAAAPPPEQAAGTAGRRHGGDPRGRRAAAAARPRPAARLRKHQRTEKGNVGPQRRTTRRKQTYWSRLDKAADREEPGAPRSGRGGRGAGGLRRESGSAFWPPQRPKLREKGRGLAGG